ncbi:MAG: inositol-3-phosphate synthase [Bacteroidales bacterium]|jgi:myo-inositol-1-phosphate synthase|nr:inositol-3-phosphate synthase [Bacteroidales bacterium]MBP5764433.1 inositol-3-phosphate synthase [Bacteroidales bacterium]
MKNIQVQPAEGRLGVLVVGLGGAVSTTFIIGTLAARKGLAKPIGSMTQLSYLKVGKGNNQREGLIKDLVPLASLDQLVFGGWDIFPDSVYDGAMHAQVLTEKDINLVAEEAKAIKPMKAAFDPNFITRLNGTWCKEGKSKWDLMEQLRADIRNFKQENNCNRVVVIWAASTEAYLPMSDVHADLSRFEAEMKNPDTKLVAPSMCYAYAAMKEGAPFINGAPALTVDFPAMWQLADETGTPICGKDYKSGQTMMKTVLAPAFHARMLGLAGWFSTNILGNRDGEVLDDPASFKTKEVSKLSVIDSILEPEKYPDLYGDIYHKVRINYYPPRNDNKEAWDNIDIFGWMGYPMQIKVNFLCRDSILAAPLALDLVLLSDLAKRCGFKGIQKWLSFYFKSPMHELDEVPVHSLFEQDRMFRDKLREIIGEE